MKLTEIKINNFRLLKDVSIHLNENNATTVFVGPNNSGKTSVSDALQMFIIRKDSSISIYDFNVTTINEFHKAQEYIMSNEINEDFNFSLPYIYVQLHFEYGDDSGDLAVASNLLMDLEQELNTVVIRSKYELSDGIKLAEEYKRNKKADQSLYDFLKDNLNKYYVRTYYKVSPKNDHDLEKLEEKNILDRLIMINFISAQRHIDDKETGRSTKLSQLLHEYFDKQYRQSDPDAVEKIEEILKEEVKKFGDQYEKVFKDLIENLKNFGYPDGKGPSMVIRAVLSASNLFQNYTQIFYGDVASSKSEAEGAEIKYELPEKYNGLGYKNLIYMVLQIQSFRIALKQMISDIPKVHIIFIEEPEIHLHPQVQSVVMKNITDLLKQDDSNNCHILITTHSSHMVADSDFSPIRYFSIKKHFVEVKDLLKFQIDLNDKETIGFLRKYMSQMKCDLFFSHKAILIEGQVERLLLPRMIKVYAENNGLKFDREYITIMDVGGAYAHKFKDILNFLDIPTLVITDIDSIKADRTACIVSEGIKTSNAMLKKWIPNKESIKELIGATNDDKRDGCIRVAYQVSETDDCPCGRSFEEAFIYKNAEWILKNKDSFIANKGCFNHSSKDELIANAYEINLNKVDFALDLIVTEGWETPRYIQEGIEWLATLPTA